MMLPEAGISQVFGLLDIVRAYKGKTDVANLSVDLRLDIDELLPIMDTAQLLGLVTVSEGDIALTELGKKMLTSQMQARKSLIGDQLKRTQLYLDLGKMLTARGRVSRNALGKTIESKTGPMRDVGAAVNSVIRWGVFAELFHYDGGSGHLLVKQGGNAPMEQNYVL